MALKQVEEFYGIRIKSMPSLLVSHRHILPDVEALGKYVTELYLLGRIPRAKIEFFKKWARGYENVQRTADIFSLLDNCGQPSFNLRFLMRPTGYYYAPLESVQIPPKYSRRQTWRYTWNLLCHELAHHAIWEKRSPLFGWEFSCDRREEIWLALGCAHEGLATYAEPRIHMKPETSTAPAIKKWLFGLAEAGREIVEGIACPHRTILEVANRLAFFASDLTKQAARLCRKFIWRTPETLAEAVEKSAFARLAIDKYSDGLRFVNAVSLELGGPKEAFRAITERPPQSMQEILDCRKYLLRLETEDGPKA